MMHKWGQLFIRWSARIIIHIVYRIKYVGEKKIPANGAYILCANHRSFLDIPLVGTYSKKRWIYFMGKKELFEKPFSRLFMNLMDVFPVARGKGDIGSIRKALRYLENKEMIVIFPQGTREKDGEKLEPRKGAAMIAALSGAPIIPMYIKGVLKPFNRITVYVGKPFDLGLKKRIKYSRENYEAKSKEIMDRIYALAEGY